MWVKIKVSYKKLYFMTTSVYYFRLQLNKQMERCMASVNNSLIKHNLLLGVDDRGKLSCHKVNLCFIYFEPSDCIVSFQLTESQWP